MAGHNKWSKVKHIKGPADAKRGKLFSKLSMEISYAVRVGGADIDLNPRLRQAISNAKSQNMPGDTIERALKKGSGDVDGVTYEEALYEAYAPGGIAMLVEVVTDNKNRSAADIRNILSKNGGSFADSGSVAYLFDRKGEIVLDIESGDADELFNHAIEAGAEDIESSEDGHVITTAPDQLDAVSTALQANSIEPESQKLIFKPQITIEIGTAKIASQVLRIYGLLDDYDDAQSVYANFDISDELLAEAEALID